MSSELGNSILKLLVTSLSLAIAVPGFWDEDYKIVTLTLAVFFLSRIIGVVQETNSSLFPKAMLVKFMEAISGIAGSAFCFYYFAIAFSNNTFRKDSLRIYPLFSKNAFPMILLILSAVYILTDFTFCGVAIYKKYTTHKEVMRILENEVKL